MPKKYNLQNKKSEHFKSFFLFFFVLGFEDHAVKLFF